jgi:hypothetical protein
MMQVRSMFVAVLDLFMHVKVGVFYGSLIPDVVIMVHVVVPVPVFVLKPLVPVHMGVVLRYGQV